MKRKFTVAASLLLTLGCFLRATGVPAVAAGGEGNIAVAKKAIEEGRNEEAIRLLGSGSAEDAEGRYLLGLAIFKQLTVELERLRAQGDLGPGVLLPEQAASLRECLGHLNRAVELSAAASFAPDAAFLAARVQDWGYLNRFEVAQKGYGEVRDRYPGTAAADQAAKRLEYWAKLWKHDLVPLSDAPVPVGDVPASAPAPVY